MAWQGGRNPIRPVGAATPGLYRCPDGRWRINATGKKFTCHDERQAIGRFLAWRSQQDQQREALVQIPLPTATALDDPDTAGAVDFVVRKELGPGRHRGRGDESLVLEISDTVDDPMTLLQSIPEKGLWAYVRQYLIEQPAYVAEQTGIPELAGLARFQLPKPPVRLRQVIESYEKRSDADRKSKREALTAFDRLVRFTNATTLADLTDEALLAFREHIINDPRLTSSGTQSACFYRIRNVLKIASRGSLDSVQLDEAPACSSVSVTEDAPAGAPVFSRAFSEFHIADAATAPASMATPSPRNPVADMMTSGVSCAGRERNLA